MRNYTVGDNVLVAAFTNPGSSSRPSYHALYEGSRGTIEVVLLEGVISYVSRSNSGDTPLSELPDTPITDPIVNIIYHRPGITDQRSLELYLRPAEMQRLARRSEDTFNLAGLNDASKEFLREFLLPKVVAASGYVRMLQDLRDMIPNAGPLTLSDKEELISEAEELGIRVLRMPQIRFTSARVGPVPTLEELNREAEPSALDWGTAPPDPVDPMPEGMTATSVGVQRGELLNLYRISERSSLSAITAAYPEYFSAYSEDSQAPLTEPEQSTGTEG